MPCCGHKIKYSSQLSKLFNKCHRLLENILSEAGDSASKKINQSKSRRTRGKR